MICRPWYGKQGGDFTERFAPDFKAGLELHYDKYATLRETLDGTDAGGAHGDPLPTAANDPAGRAEMIRMRAQRLRRLCAYIRLHVVDPDIQTRIDDEANSNGIDAWAIVLEHGEKPVNGLTKLNQDSEWTSLRLTDVGVDERTIIKIKGKLHRLNQARETTKTEEEKRLKFLSMISFPATLASKAVDELHRPTITRVTGSGASRTYVPDYEKTVKAFDELWRHAYSQNQIRRQAAPERSRGGHGVDAADTYLLDQYNEDVMNDNMHDANAAFLRGKNRNPGRDGPPTGGASSRTSTIEGERMCAGCLGFGHSPMCPSEKKYRRIADAISRLRAIELRGGKAGDQPDGARRNMQTHGANAETTTTINDVKDNNNEATRDGQPLADAAALQFQDLVPDRDDGPEPDRGNDDDDFYGTFEASLLNYTNVDGELNQLDTNEAYTNVNNKFGPTGIAEAFSWTTTPTASKATDVASAAMDYVGATLAIAVTFAMTIFNVLLYPFGKTKQMATKVLYLLALSPMVRGYEINYNCDQSALRGIQFLGTPDYGVLDCITHLDKVVGKNMKYFLGN